MSAARSAILQRLRALCPALSVGVLSADLMRLGDELSRLEQTGVGVAHVDVMDGCFCPALTVGPGFVKGLRTPLLKDVHLMIREPLDALPDYAAAGADIITVQVESAVHIHRVLQRLGGLESINHPGSPVVRGLALGPATPLEWLTEPLLAEVDMIVVLAVDPGYSGQTFDAAAPARVARVKEIIRSRGRDILTCIDGGVTRENIGMVAAAGADLVVTGSAAFADGEVERNISAMTAAIRG